MKTVTLELTKEELERLLSGLTVLEANSPNARTKGKKAHEALADKICEALEEVE